MTVHDSSAILVTFNPAESTLRVIESLLNEEVNLIVVDNGSDKNSKYLNEIKIIMNNTHRSIFYQFDNNEGLAAAQNKGIEISNTLGVEFVFFLDQDTLLPEKYILNMEQSFMKYESENKEKLGILAPNYFDRNTKEYAHYALLTKNGYIDKMFADEEFMEVSFVISSGSMMRLSVINEIGMYITSFFIDQVDTEYSLRMKKNGFKIVATSNCELNHTIGDREKKKLFGLIIKPNHHSELRKYYIFRNGKALIAYYGEEFPGFKVLMYKRFVHDMLGVTFYENKKMKKIKSIFIGLL